MELAVVSLEGAADACAEEAKCLTFFCIVWAEKNAERKTQGVAELNFREAPRECAPPGAVTLCSVGEDIRASPGKTSEGMDMWHARYRRGSAKGVLWRLVNDANKQPNVLRRRDRSAQRGDVCLRER